VIPLAEPNLGDRERALLNDCFDSGYVSSVGPFVERFEAAGAGLAGADHAAAVASGTAALELGLRVSGVRPGDLVIMPSYTFIATANATAHAGAEPWLFDIDPETWNLDARAVAERLRSTTTRDPDGTVRHTPTQRRVGAIIAVQVLGNTAGLGALRRLADAWGLPLIADAAAAHGARVPTGDFFAPIGSVAHFACFSFNGNKTVTAGGGGIIAGNDGAAIARVKHLSTQARTGSAYDHDEIGSNHRLTALQAAVGVAQLERLPELIGAKRRIRDRYDAALAGAEGVAAFPAMADPEAGPWLSGLVLGPDHPPAEAFCERLKERGIGARPFWKPLHLQRPYQHALRADLAHSEALWDRVVTLPCSTHLTERQQGTVIDAAGELLEATRSTLAVSAPPRGSAEAPSRS